MLPIHFGARDRQLFGLYDEGNTPRRRMGVVLLNPVGWEYLRAHRTIRALAARLAEAGFDVLRFDYSGTGDSWGDIGDGVGLSQWNQDVDEAVEELVALAGSPRVALIGLRAGAALASDAAARLGRGLEHVILWDPPGLTPAEAPSAMSDSVFSTLAPSPALLEELEAVGRRPVSTARARVHLALSDHRIAVPEALRTTAHQVITVEGSPTCWIEERHFGAGAVPIELLSRLVKALSE